MAAQQEVSRAVTAASVGRTIEVIVDEVDAESAIGRSVWDAPEIDGSAFLCRRCACWREARFRKRAAMPGALFGFAIFCGIAITVSMLFVLWAEWRDARSLKAGGFKEDHAVAFGVAFFVVIPFLCLVVDGLLR